MNLKLNKGKVAQFNFEQIGFEPDSCLSITETDKEVYSFLIDVNDGVNQDLILPFNLVTFAKYFSALLDTFKTFGESTKWIRSYTDIKEAVESLNGCVGTQQHAFKTVCETYIKQMDLFLVHIFNNQELENLIYHVEPWNDKLLLVEFESYVFDEYQITQDIKTDPAVRAHFEGSKGVR
tara:strand:+ start:1699 stop:2235 length:537 start_codon:yes stop_codon:yes gene_type:complete